MESETTNIFSRQMTRLRRVTLKPEEQNGNNIITQSIGDFIDPLHQYRYASQITAIRAMCQTLEAKSENHSQIAELKKQLPAGIISGVAVNGIGEQNIVERNGVIAVDIDAQDNPALYDWEAVKKAISVSPYIAYAGLSVSGLGVFVLIPIKDAEKHKEHFDSIVDDFANTTFNIMQYQDIEPTVIYGIKLDQAPSNIASKRFVSYDPNPYINTHAQVYVKTKEPIKLYIPKFTTYKRGKNFDVESFLNAHGIAYNVRERQGGLQYIVRCPWEHLHSSRSKAESAVFVYPDGRPGFKCMHAHCADKHWHEFRDFYEPNVYRRATTSFPRLGDLDINFNI